MVNMTRVIDWKGKIGYGDIISPICYAYNEADIRKEEVVLNFYFDHSRGTKFKDSDAETINDRVDYINRNTVDSNHKVIVNQIYDTKLDCNHTNYSDKPLSYHNLRFSNETWKGNGNHIAVISSITNKKKFSEYAKGKMWKDPLSNKWEEYVKTLSDDHSVKLIDYETSISEASDIIASSKIVIGYHGSAMWLARWLSAPMIIYSDKSITKEVFPWCIHNPINVDLEKQKDMSLYLLKYHRRELKKYVESLHRI